MDKSLRPLTRKILSHSVDSKGLDCIFGEELLHRRGDLFDVSLEGEVSYVQELHGRIRIVSLECLRSRCG
jgi:hypothetical protein